MSLAQYGFQKLLLLNSAGYSRAELPLDDSVSIIAPNNTGKTSLINALQFLLILDKRNMDFGAHNFENSRRFYFADNSAYILLEVLLPSGMAVIGCVGKGLSHDYEYFAYQGSLDADDYRLQDGSLVTQPKLIEQLIASGKMARIYQQADLKALLYGNRQKLRADDPDLTIFPLEYTSQAATYQRILTRTLRLDRLDTREVKNYLLEIFKNDLHDRSVDFKNEWDKSFADVNADKAQYDAVLRNKALIETMQTRQQERKQLRGRIIQWQPLIEQGLNEWEAYFTQHCEELQQEQNQLGMEAEVIEARQKEIYKEQAGVSAAQTEAKQSEQRCQELSVQFHFVQDLSQLKTQRNKLQNDRDELVRQIKNAQQRQSVEVIDKDIKKTQRELTELRQQLAGLNDNLFLRIEKLLPEDSFAVLNRLLARSVLSLPISTQGQAVVHDETALQSFAQQLQQHLSKHKIELPGLSLDLSTLEPNLIITTAQELAAEISVCERQLADLSTLRQTAISLAEKISQQQALESQVAQLDKDIIEYKELLALQDSATTRQQVLIKLVEKLNSLHAEEQQLGDKKKVLAQTLDKNKSAQENLHSQHRRINHARNQRQDQQESFSYLEQLPYLPCMETAGLELPNLADRIETYNRDCQQLNQLDEELHRKLNDLHHDGVSKFQYQDSSEQELETLFAFSAQLAQEKAAIERKARSAVVQVAAILRDLRSSLEIFTLRMREFNNKINRRQLSDLKVFRIEPREEESLVKAIQTLISTSEQVESGHSFDLFDHNALLDDKDLNTAKDLLIREGEARGSLKVEHLFRLVFIIAKENQPPSEFSDIDSAASNGTVLMAKLITGLAMLNQMQDPRKTIKTACYLDEAASLDQRNQRNLIETAAEFGFTLIFASPEAQITARYCVPIGSHNGRNYISQLNWQILESVADKDVV